MKKLFSYLIITILIACNVVEKPVVTHQNTIADYKLVSDIKWASPKGFDLSMDIYTPNKGKANYPVIVMFHGGGWLINNKSIMDQSAAYLATHGNYVVCNVNYRLLGDINNSVKMNEIIEDAFGAVLWVKNHIDEYKGDPKNIIVTGDSAGGHLAAVTVLQGQQLSSTSFDETAQGFRPTWLPKNKTAEDIAKENALAVQAAIISYGAFDIYQYALSGSFESSNNIFWELGKAKPRGIFGKEINVNDHPAFYKKVSPNYHIPPANEKLLPPMLFTVGEKDNVTTPVSIKAFMEKLKNAGHNNMEYWEHKGRPHAFLDSGSNEFLGIQFERDAPPALDKMITYLDRIFYNKK